MVNIIDEMILIIEFVLFEFYLALSALSRIRRVKYSESSLIQDAS